MEKTDSGNRLNELDAKEWLKFTKTWFVHNPPRRKSDEILHPAKYPEDLIEKFVTFFTKPGQVVFDPFLGTGSTLVASFNTKRNGIGIELQEKYATIAQERLKRLENQLRLTEDGAGHHCKQVVLRGNSLHVQEFWKQYQLPLIDVLITSPPYGPMLLKKGLAAAKRAEQGLDTQYSTDAEDLGNAKTYETFLEMLLNIFTEVKPLLREEAHLVVILQNYMNKGNYITLAWDFAQQMKQQYQLRGERLWCQDNKTLFPYGYRYSFVPNVHHHYCLIFKKVR